MEQNSQRQTGLITSTCLDWKEIFTRLYDQQQSNSACYIVTNADLFMHAVQRQRSGDQIACKTSCL